MGDTSASKKKACKMSESFHRAPESLLTDEREGVGIIDNNKSQRVRLCMTSLTVIIDLVADGVNPPILFGAEV
jgi:hypothetical protein